MRSAERARDLLGCPQRRADAQIGRSLLALSRPARRPVATSIAFELVRAALCLVSLASNALFLQETSLLYDPEVSGAIQALWQQQKPAPQQRFVSPV